LNKSVELVAKIDTGASHCLFERHYGEQLGLEIETGIAQKFSTATGTFLAYGHNLTLVPVIWSSTPTFSFTPTLTARNQTCWGDSAGSTGFSGLRRKALSQSR
jgi:hypothetical protein